MLDNEPPLSHAERLRRVIRFCADFTRNLAHYRIGFAQQEKWLKDSSAVFWLSTVNNSMDMCILDWCKLFCGDNDGHSWHRVVSDRDGFEAKLLQQLGVSDFEFEAFRIETKEYRDKFAAHLDLLRKMNIPKLDLAQRSVYFYCGYVGEHEAGPGELVDRPGFEKKLTSAYEACMAGAERVFAQPIPKGIVAGD